MLSSKSSNAKYYCLCLGCARKVILRHNNGQLLQLDDFLITDRHVRRHHNSYTTSKVVSQKYIEFKGGESEKQELLSKCLEMHANGMTLEY